MENFADILLDLIKEKGKSIKEISKECDVPDTCFGDYLRGSYPTIKTAVKIANYFGCSLDFLFGLTDEKSSKDYADFQYDSLTFLKRYEMALKDNKMTHYQLAKELDFNEALRRHWRKGKAPGTKILYLVAKNLSCSMDYLVGK